MIIDKCILCNIPSVDLGVHRIKDTLELEIREYTIAQCSKCKLFWNKYPCDDYETLYDGKYWHEHMKEVGGWCVEDQKRIDNDFKWANERRGDIKKWFSPTGDVLEIGCSTGSMLNLCLELGHECFGVEPDKEACRIARREKIIVKQNINEICEAIKFDYLLALDVIEHVINPLKEAEMWLSKVKQDGIIWIECPDAGCEDAVANNRGPVPELEFGYLMPFEHIYQFNQNNLRRLFESLGCICLWQGNVFTTDRQRAIFKKVF